jgi:hypothetical protein
MAIILWSGHLRTGRLFPCEIQGYHWLQRRHRGRTRFDVELFVPVLRVEDSGLASLKTPGKPTSANSHEFKLAA